MKRFEDLNYYELFDVPFKASIFEIRQAYKDAFNVYNQNSLVTYSFFTDEERGNILKRMEEAFLTLIDDKKRADYDKVLVSSGELDRSNQPKTDDKKVVPLFQKGSTGSGNVFSKMIREKIAKKDIKEMSTEILSKEMISGNDLKRIRKTLGIELDEIFEVARIRVSILKSIEDDLFEDLPPILYLKNFLKSYADILQLESNRIVEGYIKNMTTDEIRVIPTP